MKRQLFTILSALSLLLFVASILLWIGSYWREVWIVGQSTKQTLGIHHDSYSFGCLRGRIVFHRFGGVPAERRHWAFYSFPRDPDPLGGEYGGRFPSFRLHGVNREHWRFIQTIVVVPLWALMLPTLALSVWSVATRRARQTRGLCSSCGYDLRATPGRCPDCGTIPAKAVA